jgi:hypothetical protein
MHPGEWGIYFLLGMPNPLLLIMQDKSRWQIHEQPVHLAGGWWLVLVCSERKYCWLIAGGWFVPREKYCWLMVDKPNERVVSQGTTDRRSAWGSATSSTGSFASVLHSTVTTGGPSGISSAHSQHGLLAQKVPTVQHWHLCFFVIKVDIADRGATACNEYIYLYTILYSSLPFALVYTQLHWMTSKVCREKRG